MPDPTQQASPASHIHILVVDDEPDIRNLVQEILEDEGYRVTVAENGDTARQAFNASRPDLVLLDIWMPDVDGITLLKEWTEEGNTDIPVIMMSGHGTVETAVEATRLGAFDFIEKPLSLARLLLTVEQALDSEKQTLQNSASVAGIGQVNEPVGKSAAMQRLREQVKRIAEHDSWVLITGEAGSGTSVTARYLHQHSHHAEKSFVELNLSACSYDRNPEEFVGSASYQGLLQKAQGGTLYLRNIDEADEATQNFLLALFQSHTFQKIDTPENHSFSARIICSSHRDLEQLVEQQKFRKDLFYLINVVPVHVPALREHREDIPELLGFYTDMLVEREKLPYRHFSLPAQNRLRNYDWYGNIRELTNVVQRLLVTGSGNEISLEEVEATINEAPAAKPALGIPIAYDLPLREAREQFERDYLVHQLKKTGGNVGKTAKLIDMERTHLYRKLRALNIDPKALSLEDN